MMNEVVERGYARVFDTTMTWMTFLNDERD